MSGFTAFYDASVLYPSELRNLLMHLALTGLFRAKWSAAVHEEWIRALLRRRPDLSREKLERTRMLMDLHAADALVTGYEDLIEGLQLPDPDDQHVLAAAIRGQADVIVTANLRDFPADLICEECPHSRFTGSHSRSWIDIVRRGEPNTGMSYYHWVTTQYAPP